MSKSPHRVLSGLAVSPGFGQGEAYVHEKTRVVIARRAIPPSRVDREIERFDRAVAKTREQLKNTRQMVSAKLDKAHAAIFEAQEVLLDDPLLIDTCRREIRAQQLNAEYILEQIVINLRKLFEQVEASSFSLQNLDVLDVASRLRENLMPSAQQTPIDKLPRNSVLVARELLPSDTARLSRHRVAAIVTEAGGATSHFAILAKALGIPVVVGIENPAHHIQTGDSLIVDGYTGKVTVEPSRQDLERLNLRLEKHRQDEESLAKIRDLPCETTDGYIIRLMANMELPSEVPAIQHAGARGIGLFRTEFFYLNQGGLPGEDAQYQAYREVIEAMAPLPVTIRTLDLGGDKLMGQADADASGFSYMGLRSIRFCLANPAIFKTQLRAIMRASAHGNTRIMFPLVIDLREVLDAREMLAEVQADLQREGIPFDPAIQVGSMIETPAAALTSEQLAAEVDFFSIGTNDLVQYTLAVDRASESVAALSNPLHPAVLYLIRRTIEAGHQAGIPVAMCGEMASDPALAALLLGLGIDELSMTSSSIPEVKRFIRSVSLDEIRHLRQQFLTRMQSAESREILNRFVRRHNGRDRRRRR